MLFGTQAAIIYSRIFRFTVHVTFYGRIDLFRFSIAFGCTAFDFFLLVSASDTNDATLNDIAAHRRSEIDWVRCIPHTHKDINLCTACILREGMRYGDKVNM